MMVSFIVGVIFLACCLVVCVPGYYLAKLVHKGYGERVDKKRAKRRVKRKRADSVDDTGPAFPRTSADSFVENLTIFGTPFGPL